MEAEKHVIKKKRKLVKNDFLFNQEVMVQDTHSLSTRVENNNESGKLVSEYNKKNNGMVFFFIVSFFLVLILGMMFFIMKSKNEIKRIDEMRMEILKPKKNLNESMQSATDAAMNEEISRLMYEMLGKKLEAEKIKN